MNNGNKNKAIFKYGSTWLRADFHLHTKADKEFIYSSEENYYFSSYVDGSKRPLTAARRSTRYGNRRNYANT
ncbi:MAG: hypothetical protein HQK65_23140 [Desulfamplus sp.]|nr:hypothetical protein [Desulfamplus sp.]